MLVKFQTELVLCLNKKCTFQPIKKEQPHNEVAPLYYYIKVSMSVYLVMVMIFNGFCCSANIGPN